MLGFSSAGHFAACLARGVVGLRLLFVALLGFFWERLGWKGLAQSVEEKIHFNTHAVFFTLTILDVFANFDPGRQREVDCLCDVEAGIESSMVSFGPRNDELTRTLVDLVQLYAFLKQDLRVNQGSLVAQELRALFETV